MKAMASICKRIVSVGPAPGVEWHCIFGTKTNSKFVNGVMSIYHPSRWTTDIFHELLLSQKAMFNLDEAAINFIVTSMSVLIQEGAGFHALSKAERVENARKGNTTLCLAFLSHTYNVV